MIAGAAAIVLAGGASRRFGSPKALAPWAGGTLIEAVLDTLAPLFPTVLVVVKRVDEFAFLRRPGLALVEDDDDTRHPAAGILAGLRRTGAGGAFVCGCDMPFLRPDLASALWNLRGTWDAVVPVFADRMQPLCAYYAQTCRPALESVLTPDSREASGLHRLLAGLNVRLLSEDQVRALDPEGVSFRDVDTPLDYARAVAQRIGPRTY
jgi:molybdopterin-guanine dinucleotide biosynthesis protein A